MNDFVRVEGACVKRAIGKDGGTCLWALYADATTLVVKDEPFDCCLQLYPKQMIKDLLFQASIATDFVSTIAFIVGKIENATRSDGTPSYRLTIVMGLRQAIVLVSFLYLLDKLSKLGFGKKVFGTLEITSLNSLDVSTLAVHAKAGLLVVKPTILFATLVA
ncbi:hypothetical protein L7F22_026468 [Adiantum nelumboides]|nr:hypothetical protein [Adiantum nelumboides]